MIPRIVEEHFDELDWLCEHRDANLFTPDWVLSDLADVEDRVEAHLDGLRLSELHGVELAQERMGSGEVSAVTAATLVLWDANDVEYRRLILQALHEGGPDVTDGIRRALRHRPTVSIDSDLHDLLEADDLQRAAVAADLFAFHRTVPEGMASLLRSDNPHVLGLAIGAAGRLGTVTDEHLGRALASPEADVRRAGLEAAARCGLSSLGRQCREAAGRSDPVAIEFLGVLGEPQDVATLIALTTTDGLAGAAISGLGAAGHVAGVPTLIELIEDGKHGVAATAAYTRITGALDIHGERPATPASGEEEDADEGDGLPLAPDKVRDDWTVRGPRLLSDHRWQCGQAVPNGGLPSALDALSLESRRDVYLNARSRVGDGAPDIELEAFAIRQRGGHAPS